MSNAPAPVPLSPVSTKSPFWKCTLPLGREVLHGNRGQSAWSPSAGPALVYWRHWANQWWGKRFLDGGLSIIQQHPWVYFQYDNFGRFFFEARVLGQSLKLQALESHYLDLNPSSATYGRVIVDQASCSAFYSLSSCKTQIIVAPRVIPCKALNQVKQVVGTQHYSSSFCH